jgi:predicted nucleic acid-binding Zn ribbon protein
VTLEQEAFAALERKLIEEKGRLQREAEAQVMLMLMLLLMMIVVVVVQA